MLWETKLRIVTSGLLDVETLVNKICLGPLLHNCLGIGNANPGCARGGCVRMSCCLGFPWYLLDETFKLLCELGKKKINKFQKPCSINHWVESVSNSQPGTLDLAPATVLKENLCRFVQLGWHHYQHPVLFHSDNSDTSALVVVRENSKYITFGFAFEGAFLGSKTKPKKGKMHW